MNIFDIVTYTPYSDDTQITSARKGAIIAIYPDGTADISLTADDGSTVIRQKVTEAGSGFHTFEAGTETGPGSQVIQLAASDLDTALAAQTGVAYFRAPYAMNILEVRAALKTAQASGSIFTVDINKNGTSVLSTKLTIDNTEKTSKTAATPAVISTAAIADDDEITIDIDQIGNGSAKGLTITLIVDPV
jgi:hypothetical protein